MTDELKQCPFCNGDPLSLEVDQVYETNAYCPNCDYSIDIDTFKSRPIEATLRAQLAEAEKVLERIIQIDRIVRGKLLSDSDCINMANIARVYFENKEAGK